MANKVVKTIEINDVKYDLNVLPDGGDNGQVLTKRDDGAEWVYYTPKIWKGTLMEYVSIVEKDPECIYFIVESDINSEEL